GCARPAAEPLPPASLPGPGCPRGRASGRQPCYLCAQRGPPAASNPHATLAVPEPPPLRLRPHARGGPLLLRRPPRRALRRLPPERPVPPPLRPPLPPRRPSLPRPP